jgi:hypothetical protein
MSGVSFTLSLVDKVSAPAKAAGGSFGSLAQQSKTLQSAMTSLEKQMTKASALGDQDKVKELSTKYDAFGASLKDVNSQMAPTAGALDGVGAAVAGTAAAATAAVGAVLALGAAFAAITLKGAELALSVGEAKEKLTATLTALAGGPAAGAATLDMLDSLRGKLGLTREELAPMAEQLLAMGYTGAKLQTQLTALATVKAVGVDGGTEEYTNILKKLSGQAKVSTKDLTNLYKTGVSEADLASKMGISVKQLQAGLKAGTIDASKFSGALTSAVTSKGAGALAQQASSLSAQWDNFKETLADLFNGVNAKPFLDALKQVFALFGQNTASGQAMKFMITSFFNETFALAAKALPYIKTGIELIVIGFLKAYIYMKPLIASFKEWLTTGGGLSTIWTVLKGIGVVLGLLTVGAVAFAAVLIGPFVAAGAAIAALGVGVAWLVGEIAGAVPNMIKAFDSFVASAGSIASDFITGLVGGITSGASQAIAAVMNLGQSMLSGVKNTLGIHSPSVEMAKLGVHTATGFAQGVASGTGKVADAAGGVGSAATGGVAGGAAPSSSPSGGGGNEINITVNVGGASGGAGGGQQDGKAMGQMIAEELSLLFEKMGLSGGAALG